MTKKAGRSVSPPHEQQLLDSVFSALCDPVRRAILERLSAGPLLVSELAQPFEISLQAISRHIQVLQDAGLVLKERTGRISRCALAAGPIHDVVTWLNRYSDHWDANANAQPTGASKATKRR